MTFETLQSEKVQRFGEHGDEREAFTLAVRPMHRLAFPLGLPLKFCDLMYMKEACARQFCAVDFLRL